MTSDVKPKMEANVTLSGNGRRGFTLLELLVVIGLMVLVTTIVVSGTFGMARASSYLAAENVLLRTIQNTRQSACTSGRKEIIAFVGPDNGEFKANSFVTIEAAGMVTEEVNGRNYIQDRTAVGHMPGGIGSRAVWNLRSGKKYKCSSIQPIPSQAVQIPGYSDKRYSYCVTQITFSDGFGNGEWVKGDTYGFQIADIQYMPTGFEIAIGTQTERVKEGQLIVFKPDGKVCLGTASVNGIEEGPTDFYIYVYEAIKSNSSLACEIHVKNGMVSVRKRSGDEEE